MFRFLLRNGADPNQEAFLPVKAVDPLTYVIDRIDFESSPVMCCSWDEFKRLKDMEKLFLEYGGKIYNEEYEKIPVEEREQPECEFEYEFQSGMWMHMSLQVNGKKFSSHIGTFGHDIKDILYALYVHAPCEKLNEDECGFIRRGYTHEDAWFVLHFYPEGPSEFSLSFDADPEGKTLKIRIKIYDEVYLLEECSLGKFVYAVVEACDKMLKKHGLLGFSKSFCSSNDEFDINVFLVLKEWVMEVRGYSCKRDKNKRLYYSDYEKELAILAMPM